jgi:hypothetical protein
MSSSSNRSELGSYQLGIALGSTGIQVVIFVEFLVLAGFSFAAPFIKRERLCVRSKFIDLIFSVCNVGQQTRVQAEKTIRLDIGEIQFWLSVGLLWDLPVRFDSWKLS